jgi:hypothetical protein
VKGNPCGLGGERHLRISLQGDGRSVERGSKEFLEELETSA